MVDSLPTYREMLAYNRRLPEALRSRSVIIRFKSPQPAHILDEFTAIQLTPAMLAGGEEEFFQPEIFQRHRVGNQKCQTCGRLMQRLNRTAWKCVNPRCLQEDGRPTSTLLTISGPLRGVIDVRKEFQATNSAGREVDVTFLAGAIDITAPDGSMLRVPTYSGALLVLDRRYHDAVLCAVYRTAGQLCDMLGIRMR